MNLPAVSICIFCFFFSLPWKKIPKEKYRVCVVCGAAGLCRGENIINCGPFHPFRIIKKTEQILSIQAVSAHTISAIDHQQSGSLLRLFCVYCCHQQHLRIPTNQTLRNPQSNTTTTTKISKSVKRNGNSRHQAPEIRKNIFDLI